MMSPDDAELLREFSERGSESAFAALARRHSGLLFHSALRLTGRADLAEEASQNALAILARKASRLSAGQSLAPWLHRTVCFEAGKLRRRENRHAARMKHLKDYSPTDESGSRTNQIELASHLDEGLNALPDRDREVLMLRFFEGLSFEEMALQRGGLAATWRQRGLRALERLRRWLAKRQVIVPLAVLTVSLSASLSQAAPPAVVASLVTTAPAVAASISWKTLLLHSIHTMNVKHMTLAAAVVITTLVPIGFQAIAVNRAAAKVAALESAAAALTSEPGAARMGGFGPTPPGGSVKEQNLRNAALPHSGGGLDLRATAKILADGRKADKLQLLKVQEQISALDAQTLDGLLMAARTLDLPPGHKVALYDRLVIALAENDPARAAATGLLLARGLTGDDATRFWMNPLPNVMRIWAEKDPEAARLWFASQLGSGSFEARGLGNTDVDGWVASGVFTGMMWGGHRTSGLAFFETLDEAAKANALRRFGTSNDTAADHDQILALAAPLTRPDWKLDALLGATQSLARRDLEKAGAFIAQANLPSTETRRLLVAAAVEPLHQGGSVNAGERLEWLRSRTPADQRGKAMGYFLGEALSTDPTGVRTLVDTEMANGGGDAFLGAFLRNAALQSMSLESIAAYLPQLTDPSERARTLREIQQAKPSEARSAAIRAGIPAAELESALSAH